MKERLTHRERLLRTMRFQPVDRVPDLEFHAWIQTTHRWSREGMDTRLLAGLGNPTGYLERYFCTDDDEYGPGLATDVGLLPAFEEVVLEERGQNRIFQDTDGAISEQLKPEYGATIPHYLRYAIQTRADWERIRDERLDPDHPDRVPDHLDALARRLKDADYPISVFCGSLYGRIRNWMGVERLSYMLYDDRPLVEEMMEHLTQLTLHVLQKLAGRGLRIDRGDWWEDMAFRSGSLISPRLFAELMVPRYKRITDFLRREFGTEFNQLDCDGNIHQLVPLWLDGGINVMFPIEVAHTDPYRISHEFGKRAALRGAFDKRALIEGPAAIDAEWERLRPLLQRGGLIPHTDHLVPPDVSLESFIYYRRKKCEIIGKPWREPGARPRPGHLLHWLLLGPFDNQGNSGFATPLPPEQNPQAAGPFAGKDGRMLDWQPYQGTSATGYVDLKAALGGGPWCVGYAACSLYAPDNREGWLELGSDGGLQVWLNGEQVHCKTADRYAAPAQNLIPVRLRSGWNSLMLKIAGNDEGWGFLCRPADLWGNLWPDVRDQI
jgi:uroporphyrinogen-III decarboxylase